MNEYFKNELVTKEMISTVSAVLIEKTGKTRQMINRSFNQGSFSKELSYELGKMTHSSPLFWQAPERFNRFGRERK
jgi:hypothetical protein